MSVADIKAHLIASDHNWSVSEQEGNLVIINNDDITAILVVTEQQMLIESLLFPDTTIADQAKFDDRIMYLQKQLPLTTVGKTYLQGESYYTAFGALSAESNLDSIELELVMLFQNVTELLHFSSEYFTTH